MVNDFPVLQKLDLLLRRIEPSDLSNIHQGLSDPRVTQYYAVNYPTLAETKEQMEWYARLEKKKSGIWWAICLADQETFLGAIGLNDIIQEHRKAELGFWLLPEFWGMGILQRALPLVLEYGYQSLGLHRIESYVETRNRNSQKALLRAGFTLEGTLRDCEIKNGAFISLDIYARLIEK